MARSGRPAAALDDWLDWQQRLASQKASGLSVEVYCLQEGVTRSTFYRWQQQLKNGVPAALLEDEADRLRAESEEAGETVFLPVSLQASPVEIELPNGGIVRLPLGIGQAALVAVIEAAGTLRPWKAPQP
jgi:transposase-like protein